MNRQIEIGVDVFAAIWSVRRANEVSEDQILARVLKVDRVVDAETKHGLGSAQVSAAPATNLDVPASKRWTDVLIWSLKKLGGKGTLSAIYKMSKEGRRALGLGITPEHDAAAR